MTRLTGDWEVKGDDGLRRWERHEETTVPSLGQPAQKVNLVFSRRKKSTGCSATAVSGKEIKLTPYRCWKYRGRED